MEMMTSVCRPNPKVHPLTLAAPEKVMEVHIRHGESELIIIRHVPASQMIKQ